MIDPIKLHAYADGEATRDEIAEIEARLEGCAASRAELEAIRSFKACVGKTSYAHDHSECWKACQGRLNEIDRSRKTERFVGKYAWAFASGIVALVVLTGVARRGTTSPQLGSADLATMMSQLGTSRRSAGNPREQEIARAFLERSKLVLEDQRLVPVQIAESVFEGMIVRRITLRDGRGHLALLDLPSEVQFNGLEPVSGSSMLTGQLDEQNCVVWPSPLGSRALVLVGDRDATDLARIAKRIHELR